MVKAARRSYCVRREAYYGALIIVSVAGASVLGIVVDLARAYRPGRTAK